MFVLQKKFNYSLVLLLLTIGFLTIVLTVSVQAQTPSQVSTPSPTGSQANTKSVNELNDRISELQKKVNDLQSEGKTLSSQITVMDNQMKLTQYRIDATKEELSQLSKDIDTTSGKIDSLDGALDKITKTLISRINASYQMGAIQPLSLLLSANNFSEFISKINYVRIVQANDRKLMYNTVQARNDYENQKEIFEGKKEKVLSLQTQLEGYTKQLDTEKNAKDSLLKATKNDEKVYQNLLSKARSEYQAVVSIIAGNGAESVVGTVGMGERIASVIPGSSCNSNGGHLHFIVSRNGAAQNPFSYLKPIDHENCSGSSCGSGDGDAFNPSGSWDWPLNGPIRMTQGYGSTWATRNTWVGRIYSSHNGLDINGSSNEIKAVQPGTLYRGSYGGSGGCRLPYVRLRHEDGLDTFYLHVYY